MCRICRHLVIITYVALLGACSLLPEQKDPTEGWTADQLYEHAKSKLNSGDYENAVDHYEKLEARYPFGRYAQQAQLDMAYAYYKQDEPESAIATLDRFLRTYPRHPSIDYAYYLRGLTNFNRGQTVVDRFLPSAPAERDPGASRQAFLDFSQLVKRYPESKYAGDAAQRMLYLRNNVAEYEIHVADFYIRRGAWLAAANRARYVIENYQGTPAVYDALGILEHAYALLGLEDLRKDVLRVIEVNYPDHPSLTRAER